MKECAVIGCTRLADPRWFAHGREICDGHPDGLTKSDLKPMGPVVFPSKLVEVMFRAYCHARRMDPNDWPIIGAEKQSAWMNAATAAKDMYELPEAAYEIADRIIGYQPASTVEEEIVNPTRIALKDVIQLARLVDDRKMVY